MDKHIEKALADLDLKIRQAEVHGKAEEIVAARGQKGLIYASVGAWAESAREFDLVAHLAIAAGETGGQAMARYGQAVALFHLPGKHQEARQLLHETVALAGQIGHYTLAAKAHFILYTFHLEANDLLGAIKELDQAVDLLDPESEPQLAVQIYQTRASLKLIQVELEQAQADLDEALRAAKLTGNQELVLAVQLDQQVLQGFSVQGTTNLPELFNSLSAHAKYLGNKGIAGDVKLHQAISFLQTGQLKPALKRARQVRQEALQSKDHLRYLRYLLACLLIAEICERQNDRVGVLEILLTCKTSLEGALGKEAGQLVTPFLDALHYRWGPEALQEALQDYNEHITQTDMA